MFISQTTDFHFANYRFSFRKLQISISQTTDSHFANYRFSFRKLQISISQTTDFHFANYRFPFPFRFVPFRFANYSKPIKNEFYLRGGFPCVIGCVDGTHVRLQAPSKHENNYVNRKGFHSINVQGVCNHEGE